MLTQKYDPQQNQPLDLISNGPDRRIARRYRLNWVVKIKGLDQSSGHLGGTGELQNLSSTGAAVKLSRAAPAGARYEVLIRLPLKPEKWIRYCGKALRAQVADSRAEVAIRFDSARPVFMADLSL